jgi:hypothetical protein
MAHLPAAPKAVRVYSNFDNLPDACRTLFASAESRNGLFFSTAWFMNLEQSALQKESSLRLYVVEEAGTAMSVLALPMLTCLHAPKFGTRKLSAFGNYYTCFFGLILPEAGTVCAEDLQLLADFISRESRWDVIDLHPLDPEDAAFEGMRTAFRRAGIAVQPYFCFGNWYLEVAGRSYRQYFESLPAKIKNTVRRKSAQMEKAETINIRILRNADHADEAIAAFTQVYAASWKSPEPHEQFMPGLIRLCAAKGWLRMGVAYMGEKPIAAQLWIVSANVASIYKLAYDEDFARLSIGSILTARLFEHVIDVDKVREVDYLTGDEPYKKDWMSHRRERWGLAAYNLRTARGLLAASGSFARSAMKRLVK